LAQAHSAPLASVDSNNTMKLLIQRVTRATLEVDGMVEARIGSGLVLSLASRPGDSAEKAKKLAAKVVKLLLWPDLYDVDKLWKSTVVDQGFEILAMSQQSLLASFPKFMPEESLVEEEAKAIFEAFVEALKKEYQEEMIVGAPISADMKVEIVNDGPCVFELDTDELTGQRVSKAAVSAAKEMAGDTELTPSMPVVTSALQRLPKMMKSKATLEACKVFRVLSMKQFRAALADATQVETDRFAEALDAAGMFFSKKQQEQVQSWTGLKISAAPGQEAPEDPKEEDELDRKLAELRDEVAGKPKKGIKEELTEEARVRPDWQGKAAPNTPGGAQMAPPWTQRRGGPGIGYGGGFMAEYSRGYGYGKGGSGKGKGKWTNRSYGIASLDESARIHGSRGSFEHGQLSALPDHQMKVGNIKKELGADGKEGDETEPKRPASRPAGGALKRPKGMPTLAPMTPAFTEESAYEEL